jgi:LysR family transcriptional activator of glutamate synthase operon
MDLHHLRVFQAAARTLSFTAAGRDLSLSQSTVSLHIKQLENEFGCQLFLRSRKKVALSNAGRTLLQYVDRTFTELKNAELAVREFSSSHRGTIRLGVGATTLIYLLPPVLARYRRKYPEIEILVTTATTEVLLQSTLNGEIDLAIVMSPSDALAEVETIALMEEELVFVFPPRHPLAQKTTLRAADLQDLPFISHLRGTAMRTVQEQYFDEMGAHPRTVMEMESMEAIKSLIRAGMGSSLLPLCCVTGLHGRGLMIREVSGLKMTRHLLLAVNDWRAHPPAIHRLAKRIIKAFGGGTAPGSESIREVDKVG